MIVPAVDEPLRWRFFSGNHHLGLGTPAQFTLADDFPEDLLDEETGKTGNKFYLRDVRSAEMDGQHQLVGLINMVTTLTMRKVD